jgi:hypothetical protein
MYKLFYINKFGQICNSKGELGVNFPAENVYFEGYENIDTAKSIAEIFVKKYPMLGCMISPGEDGKEELIIKGSG